MTPNPVLLNIPEQFESERLTLRVPRAGDGAALNATLNTTMDSLKVYMPWMQALHTLEQDELWCRQAYARFLNREDIAYHLRRKTDDTLIGTVGLHRGNWEVPWLEVGYWLHHSAEKNGYMHEAVQALMHMTVASIGVVRLEIRCDARNTASANVALKSGFTQVGRLNREGRDPHGNIRDMLLFEWLKPAPMAPA